MQDAIQRLVGIVGVQGGEAEVPRLGELDGELHGLLGADFTDEDDIRGLAQGSFEGDIEGSVSIPTSRWVTRQRSC